MEFMTVFEILDHEVFQLPKKRIDANVETCLCQFYQDYLRLLSSVTESKFAGKFSNEKQKLIQHCDLLERILQNRNSNRPEALRLLTEAIKLIEEQLFPEDGTPGIAEEYAQPFYRARKGTNQQFSREKMFHISSKEEEFIDSERFSIAGTPCLYLSNSIYVCWEELNRPNINTMMVSRFCSGNNHKLLFLDLSLTPFQIKTYLQNMAVKKEEELFDNKLLFAFLMRWPLTVSCSLQALKEDQSFQPEYYIPQMLMQWIIDQNRVEGVKYFSIKANPFHSEDYSSFINFALPAGLIDDDGYSKKLRKVFKLTEPISWELIQIFDPQLAYTNKALEVPQTNDIVLELIKGYKKKYARTLFGKMEWLLNSHKFQPESI